MFCFSLQCLAVVFLVGIVVCPGQLLLSAKLLPNGILFRVGVILLSYNWTPSRTFPKTWFVGLVFYGFMFVSGRRYCRNYFSFTFEPAYAAEGVFLLESLELCTAQLCQPLLGLIKIIV